MPSRKLLLVLGVILLLSIVDAEELDEPEQETNQKPFPTFDAMINGRHVVVPYYDPDCPDMPKERREFDQKAFAGLEQILNELITDLLIKKKPIYRLTSYPFKLYSFVTKTKAESAELINRGFGKKMGDDFVRDALIILKDLKKYPDPVGKANSKMTKEEKDEEARQLAKEFRSFLDIFKQTVEQSPVGKYLDWSKMTIDGAPVAKESARYYNYFENNGYKQALFIMNGVIGLLEKIKG